MAVAAIDKDEGEHTKSCACGVRYTRDEWGRLPRVGVQDDGIDLWELRRCRCGSTLGIYLGPSRERLP